MQAVVTSAKRDSLPGRAVAPQNSDAETAVAATLDTVHEAGALSKPEDGKKASPMLVSGTDEDADPVPPGMDLSAYRLALGRSFGNLLDEDIRAGLPAGELTFGIHYRAGGSPPSLQLVGVADQVLSEQLLALMRQALALTPLPASWLARDYRMELRAVIVGA